jgi:hypothetical protein
MTNEEALEWCRKHSVLVIFHEDKTVMALPYIQMDVEAFKESGFKLVMRNGFALSYTEPGDDFHHVVEAAIGAWVSNLSPVDKISEAIGKPTHRVRLKFKTNM